MPNSLPKFAGHFGPVNQQAIVFSILIAALVFLADLFTPLGVASGVPYSLAVLVSVNSNSRKYVLIFAALCMALTICALFIGPGRGGSELWKVLTNRFLAVFMIWTTTVLGLMRKRADIKRKEAEEETRLHLADLAHMGRIKTAGQLAASLAHELNQPLAAIALQSDIARQIIENRSLESNQGQLVESLSEVADQSQRAAAIIQCLRNLVRKTEPKRAPLAINELIQEVSTLMDVQAQIAEVRLKLRLNKTPEILGDRIQIEQVLLNLLQNSIDAVSNSEKKSRDILVETTPANDHVMVSVKDNGIGLGETDVEQVFERFYSSKENGMGMGLAISRSIIEAHGGKLWAEVNQDRGTTFRFQLPHPH